MTGISLSPNRRTGASLWQGSGLRQSNILNSFSYEKFMNCAYYIVLNLTVFIYFTIQCLKALPYAGDCPVGKGNSVRRSLSP